MTKCKNVVMIHTSIKHSSMCFQVFRRKSKVLITTWHDSDIVSELPYTLEEADEKWDEALADGYRVAF